jgi:hypothetical protein
MADGVSVMELTVDGVNVVGELDTDSDLDPQSARNAATLMTSDRITMLPISSFLYN